MKGRGVLIFWIALGMLFVGGLGASFYVKKFSGKYDALAQCLGDKGVIFYGAYWCEKCKEQKRLFGNSARFLPYVECFDDLTTKKPLCIEKKIVKHPAWDFADGSRLTGVQLPAVLAEKAGCLFAK